MNVLSQTAGVAQYRAALPSARPSADALAPQPERANAHRSGADTVKLTTRSSLEEINNFLKTAIGEKVGGLFAEAGVEPADVVGVDFSPEATASRIVEFSTSLFEVYEAQNKDLGEEELRSRFEDTIREAIDEGAKDAFVLIEASLGEGATDIGRETIDLVHTQLDAYFAELRGEERE